MFRIRRVYDDITPANKDAITQVQDIMRGSVYWLAKKRHSQTSRTTT